MKRIFSLLIFFVLISYAGTALAQVSSQDMMKDLQNLPPQVSIDINQAIQRGDVQTARRIYLDYKNSIMRQPAVITPGGTVAPKPVEQKPSIFESTLSGQFPVDLLTAGLQQFGYDTFLKTTESFAPPSSVPVGPDYIIGPGDQFTLTLWGTTEGIFNVTVSKEGNITLPKVGVVPVAGVRFGEIERTIKGHLSRYYTNFNLSVAMGSLKTITVYVVGDVANPGSYALPSLTTVYGALFTAGGPTKKGTMRNIQVLRSGKAIKTIDLYDFLLKGDKSQDVRLQHEDTVFVPMIGPLAGIEGAVYRPAIYELKGQETISDLIHTAGGIMPIALGGRLKLTRFSDNQKKIIMDVAMPNASGKQPAEAKQKVMNMDLVSILPIYDKVWETVNLSGAVQHPGDLEWRADLKLKEVIGKGGLLPTSDLNRAEVIRLTKDFINREVISINLEALLQGDETQNIALQPQDMVRVYSKYRKAEKVSVTGEVMRPGVYEISNGERLSDLMRRVGGFTLEAYVYGAVFKRANVKDVQAKNIQLFITKLQTDILQSSAQTAATALSAEEIASAKAEAAMSQSLLSNLKAIQEQFEGRVAINITENIDQWAGTKDDLLLQEGDAVLIPKTPQEVSVLGEIHSPGAQIYQPGMRVRDYIDLSGGYTRYADEDQVYVIQANGFSLSSESPSVSSIERLKLKPGDIVFVPQRVERYATMRFVRDIIDILFKSAVVLATITVIF